MEELIIGLYENRLFVDLSNIFYEKALLYQTLHYKTKKLALLQAFLFWLLLALNYSPTTSKSISVTLLPPKSIVAL